MNSIYDWKTRLYLASQGTLSIANVFVEDLTYTSSGSALLISSTAVSVSLSLSEFHNCSCTSTGANWGGTICVQSAGLFDMNRSCFSNNFGYGCPDVVVWGNQERQIRVSSVNTSSFCKSSTYASSSSCSNWFCADLLTVNSLNTSSMNAKIRCSGIGFATKQNAGKVNIPKISYVLIDNCSTANYIIEISVESSTETQILDHFVVTNCAASVAVIRNAASASFSLLFSESVLNKIESNLWVGGISLFLSFHSSLINDTPSTDNYAATGTVEEWTGNYKWPDLLQCFNKVNMCLNEGKLAYNKLSLLLSIATLFPMTISSVKKSY